MQRKITSWKPRHRDNHVRCWLRCAQAKWSDGMSNEYELREEALRLCRVDGDGILAALGNTEHWLQLVLYCELTLIRQIRPRTAEACHGKEVGRPPTRGASQLPPPTNSQPTEKNNNLIAAPSQPLTLPDTSKDKGKNRKGDGQQKGHGLEVPSHGTGGHIKDFENIVKSERRSSQVFPPEVQHRSSTRSARDHIFALVAGSTRATTTFCASTAGVLAWSAIPGHGHSTTCVGILATIVRLRPRSGVLQCM